MQGSRVQARARVETIGHLQRNVFEIEQDFHEQVVKNMLQLEGCEKASLPELIFSCSSSWFVLLFLGDFDVKNSNSIKTLIRICVKDYMWKLLQKKKKYRTHEDYFHLFTTTIRL